MSRAGTIARRTLLVGSAAITGGVVFGVWWYHRPPANPLLDGLAPGETALTPYVRITADGITLITPHADLGQGAHSIQAALIAEELDVELDQVTVDPGPPDPAYYNTALADEAVPFRPTDDGFVAGSARTLADAMMKALGMQITGGSTTVPDSFRKLRAAGAVARETLKAAAERQTGVPRERLSTAGGAVLLPDGAALPYTGLAPLAATIEPVRNVALRPPEDWRMLGQPMRRLDIVAKSTGRQVFGIDLAVEGMVHAAVRRNPRPGGALTGFDATRAQAMRGVLKVVPVSGGVGVIADNTWRAFRAVQAIDCGWGPAPFPPDMDAHWQTLADSFSDDRIDSRRRDDGDVEAALAGARVIAAEYRAPYLAHAPLEPLGAIVRVTDTSADVWTATQIPRFVQKNVADLAGLPREAVNVHVQYAGGSFGHRLEDAVVRLATELALAMKGTPVKLTLSREEDMLHDIPRQIAIGRMRGAVSGGRVAALDLGIAMPSVMASQMGRQGIAAPGPDMQIVAGAWEQPYAIPDYRVTGYRAPELAPVSSWRSVGASTNAFFHESALDELIHAAGADPLEERLRLIRHAPSRRTLEAVAEMSGWGSPLAEGTGRGVAFCLSFGAAVAEVCEVSVVEGAIRIDKVWVAAEVGRVLDPINFDNQVKGGVVWGLGHAMNCQITYADGMAQQDNFHACQGMRFHQCPRIEVRGLENGDRIRGIGEPPVPPAAPALANAIFAATGQRLREMPFDRHVDFV